MKWGLYREASSEDYGEIFLLNDVNRVVSARCQVSLVTDGDRKGQFMLLVNGIFRQDFGRFLRFMFKTDVVSGFVDKWDKFKLVAKNLRQTLQIQQDIALSKGKSQKSQALPPSKEAAPTFHFTNETSGSDGEFDGNNSDEYQEVGMMGSKGKSNAVFQQGKSGDGHRGPGSVVPGPAQHYIGDAPGDETGHEDGAEVDGDFINTLDESVDMGGGEDSKIVSECDESRAVLQMMFSKRRMARLQRKGLAPLRNQLTEVKALLWQLESAGNRKRVMIGRRDPNSKLIQPKANCVKKELKIPTPMKVKKKRKMKGLTMPIVTTTRRKRKNLGKSWVARRLVESQIERNINFVKTNFLRTLTILTES